FIGVVTDSQWIAFCDAFGLENLKNNPDFAQNNQRVKAREQIHPIIRETLSQLDKTKVMELCEQAGLPFSPIQRPEDLFEDIHL
ncbi:CoA transferase, partial [Acinetobacter baumannii]